MTEYTDDLPIKKITIQLPGVIRQIGDYKVEMEFKETMKFPFSSEFCNELGKIFGIREAEDLLDKLENHVAMEVIRARIIIK